MAAINKRKLLESAQKNLQKGALDKALKDYQELLAADPRDSNVRLKVGDLQLKRGNTDEAITAYLKVADQFMRDGFDAKAVAIYKQVTKIDVKRFDIYIPLADLYQRIGLTTDAMAALQTAAEAYQRDGRRREALDLLRRMASLDPTNTTSRLKVAELLHQEGLSDEAVAEYEEAAAELARQGDWEARAGILQRLLEVAPERVETYAALMALWLERGNVSRAEPVARKLVALDPTRAESHETLAGILTERGDAKGAIDCYRAAADAWLARGEEERAREILQRHVPSELFDSGPENGVPAGAVTSPITESPFGEEGIGGEPPPVVDEFQFVDDVPRPTARAPATVPATEDPEFELEFDEPTPDPPPAPAPVVVSAPAAPKPAAVAPVPVPPKVTVPAAAVAPPADDADDLATPDVEQLLAEAAVYLRYGKHERAAASYQAVLAQQPRHLGALEQLGEAQLRSENHGAAIAAWSRGVEIASGTGDTAGTARLRARIEAVDPGAAAALPSPSPPHAAAASTVLFSDATLPEAAADVAAPDTDPSRSEDDGGFEIEIDATSFSDAAVPEESSDAPDPGAPAADAVTGAFESSAIASSEAAAPLESPLALAPPAPIEAAPSEIAAVDADAWDAPDAETSEATADSLELPEPEPERVASAAAPAAVAPDAPPAPTPTSDLSTTTAQQIVEDLEEAGFYFEQGLLDEAEAIYLRVVQRAPQHPGALLRLGEIAVARGADPSGVEPAAGELPEPIAEAAPPEPEVEAAPTIEPPDDLDLTAREFGPQSGWEDEPEGEEEVEEPEGVASSGDEGDPALERTDPAEATASEPPLAAPEREAAPAASAAPAAPEPAPPIEVSEQEIPSEGDGAAAFDLAAELSEALRDEPVATQRSAATDEDGFAALFREFKRGVSRTLDEGDVETHYDLGIAYREMGLLDDAIGEFHHALGSSTRRLDALHMMGLCALDLGRGADAVGHLEQALASPEFPSEREAALRYDLARAYEAHGDCERAGDAYRRVIELDPEFQDAAQRLAALVSGSGPEEAAVETPVAEAYESFDDLLAQTADAASETPAAPSESYENFDEFSEESATEEPAASDEVPADAMTPEEDAPVVATAAPEPEVAPEPAAEPEPAPADPPKNRRKISFF